MLAKQSSNDFCNTGGITLSVIAYRSSESLSLASIKWSTGQTTFDDTISTIVVNETGKYSVTVTDVCNLSKSLEFDAVKPNNTVDSCVQFPTLFLPGTRGIMMSPDSASLTLDNYFGAFSACSLNTDSLSIEKLNLKEFEMRVFNRWGKEVFTSTDPLKRWEGKLEDGDQEYYPSDVYLWVSKYKIGEFCTSSRKGNVTLIK